MNETTLFHWLLAGWLALAVVVFSVLLMIDAPYGRHIRPGWGPTIGSRLGWLIMESAAALIFAWMYLVGKMPSAATSIVFLVIWEAHYFQRAFVYPFLIRDIKRKIPIVIVLFGLFFNGINAYLNGRYVFWMGGPYDSSWLRDPRFAFGVCLFILGYFVNRHSDNILRELRRNNGLDYKIPQKGLYRWVSNPNYLGEIILWCGWAIATWSIPGLAFAIWTAANLVPRARANHRWYRSQFVDYPVSRKVMIPGLW